MKLLTLSLLFTVAATAAITADGVTGTANPAMSGTFTMSGSSSLGLATAPVGSIILAFNPGIYGPASAQYVDGCTFQYDAINDWFYIANTNGVAGVAGYGHPGSAPNWGSFSNAQCSTNLQNVTVTRTSTTVSVTIPVTFTAAYAGVKYLWEFVNPCSCGPNTGDPTGWQNKGAWTIGTPADALRAQMASPTPGSAFAGTTIAFSWNSIPNAPVYWLDVGNSIGSGDIFANQTTGTSLTVGSLPCDGRTLYVQLYTWVNNAWQTPQRYTYNAITGCNGAVAHIVSPTPVTVLSGSTVTFTWNAVPAGEVYWFDVGNYVASGDISAGQTTGTTMTASGIPTDGRTIYVQLYTWMYGGWQAPQRYTFTAANMNFADVAAADANITIMRESDETGELVRAPTSTQPWIVKRKNGKTVRVSNAGAIKVSTLRSAHEPVADSFVYHYTIDTREVWGFRLGITEDMFWTIDDLNNTVSKPKGWAGGVSWWSADPGAEKSETSEFAIRSKWRPGLLPMFLVSDRAKEPTPSFDSTEDNMRVAVATSIFNNSLRKFVIGPAIKPDITEAELHELVTRWVEEYGFGFLRPMLGGEEVPDPEDAFEKQVLACLRAIKQ